MWEKLSLKLSCLTVGSYHELVEELTYIGYEKGQTLLGAPYDFRKAPCKVFWFSLSPLLSYFVKRQMKIKTISSNWRNWLRSRANQTGEGIALWFAIPLVASTHCTSFRNNLRNGRTNTSGHGLLLQLHLEEPSKHFKLWRPDMTSGCFWITRRSFVQWRDPSVPWHSCCLTRESGKINQFSFTITQLIEHRILERYCLWSAIMRDLPCGQWRRTTR